MEATAKSAIVIPLERARDRAGTDELNLAEFPLACLGQRSPQEKTLTFEDHIFDEGSKQRVHRKVIISGSDAFGLPTPADSDVLLVLMHLTNLRNQFTSPTVPFTRYEIVRRLDWDSGGKSYRRVEESLNRWASVTLYYNRAWWDREGRSWRSKTFHVIESLDLRGREARSGKVEDLLSSFTWNPVLFASFRTNHIKRLDLDTYFALRLPAAKQAYRFLDKRFYRSKRLTMDLKTFACEHIGLSRNYDLAQLRRKLQPTIEELETIGFLKKLPLAERYEQKRRGEWAITLIRNSKEASTGDMGATVSSSVQELTDRGVHRQAAEEIADAFTAETIREKIDYHDWLVAKGDPRIAKNAAGFLSCAIRNDYRLSDDFRRQKQVKLGRKVQTPSKAIAPGGDGTVDALRPIREHLAALGPGERQEIETQALAAASPFHQATYERLRNSGSSVLEEMRLDLIASYLSKTRIELKSKAG